MSEFSHTVPPCTSVVPLVNFPVCPVNITINTTRTISPSTAMIIVLMLMPWPLRSCEQDSSHEEQEDLDDLPARLAFVEDFFAILMDPCYSLKNHLAQQFCPACVLTSSGLETPSNCFPSGQGSACQLPPSPLGEASMQVSPVFSFSTPLVHLPICPVKMATSTTRTMSPIAATIMVDIDMPCPVSVLPRLGATERRDDDFFAILVYPVWNTMLSSIGRESGIKGFLSAIGLLYKPMMIVELMDFICSAARTIIIQSSEGKRRNSLVCLMDDPYCLMIETAGWLDPAKCQHEYMLRNYYGVAMDADPYYFVPLVRLDTLDSRPSVGSCFYGRVSFVEVACPSDYIKHPEMFPKAVSGDSAVVSGRDIIAREIYYMSHPIVSIESLDISDLRSGLIFSPESRGPHLYKALSDAIDSRKKEILRGVDRSRIN